MTRKEQYERRDKILAYKRDGHSCRETAEHFGMSKCYIERICRGIGIPEGYVNQFVSNPDYDQIANAKKWIAKANPDMEYVSGFVNSESMIVIKCNKCGDTFQRSFNSIRHGNRTTCPNCTRLAKEKKKADLITAREVRHKASEMRRQKLAEQKREQNRKAREHNCPVCGKLTSRTKYCSKECCVNANKAKYKYSAQQSATHEARRRARIKAQIVDKDITLKKLYVRDHGQCWICGMMCDYTDKRYTDKTMIAGNMYPSIDHVVALSDGGSHSWDNVKLAHRICNSLRYYAPRA